MSITEQINYYQQKLTFEIDAADLHAARQQGRNLVVVDGRQHSYYQIEHIPGAVNLPHRSLSFDTTTGLDKSALYICYCDGIGCNGSTQTALKLLMLGFEVKELIGGLDWWKRDGYPTEGSQGQAERPSLCGC
ncbi:rhodanese-like domain-containing protein [Candidatus Symbiopectobacterium sp. NZEC135]|uniref:rhodanese-like domain-containing protein n=1 Tax=Candidatus Symbiopectobacterium sp. NZEC135 TaxID=2820471 RepID=UPI0022271B20|nr:rhodanese-like domain-containing protein [Candidatus Symbiopectobacterium sp. NZEC135]MCW2480219.1 rhodanese-like domain-containing protein [Candidatus Symbiopectobacterium sp. NZEC135]